MKQAHSTVIPQEGSLKQKKNKTNHTNSGIWTIFLIVFLGSVSYSNRAFVQGDIVLQKHVAASAVATANDTSQFICCGEEKGFDGIKGNVRLLKMPSEDMFARADMEVNGNLIHSLSPVNISIPLQLLSSSDAVIHRQFFSETSISLGFKADSDDQIDDDFRAAHINTSMPGLEIMADMEMDANFREEHVSSMLIPMPTSSRYMSGDLEIEYLRKNMAAE
jgi:hypothetical protein